MLTRENFLKPAIDLLEITGESESISFADVDQNAWYYDYITIAFSNEIVFGKSETYFGIGNNITSQDAVVIAHRAIHAMKYSILSSMNSLKFEEELSEYAVNPVKELSSIGIFG